MTSPRAVCMATLFGVLVISHNAFCQKEVSQEERLTIALEAINRIESDPSANATLQSAIERVLKQVEGKPEFVAIVKQFGIPNQQEGLIEYAQANPASEAGVEAARLVLASEDQAPARNALLSTNSPTVARFVEALGNTKEKKAAPLLASVLVDKTRDVLIRRMALRSLAQTQEGAEVILKQAEENTLPGDLRLRAAELLNTVRWAEIKTKASSILPLPKTKGSESLPPVSEIAKMKGNATRGEKIYFSETVGCSTCHQVRGQGKEIGPDLSEIGTKLAKEALIEAILDPSAGISFGFEAHQVELKSGNEAYGLVASETEDTLAIKDLQGIVTTFKKREIANRRQLGTSIMPTGLAESLGTQEFVDLIEFLASLQKQ